MYSPIITQIQIVSRLITLIACFCFAKAECQVTIKADLNAGINFSKGIFSSTETATNYLKQNLGIGYSYGVGLSFITPVKLVIKTGVSWNTVTTKYKITTPATDKWHSSYLGSWHYQISADYYFSELKSKRFFAGAGFLATKGRYESIKTATTQTVDLLVIDTTSYTTASTMVPILFAEAGISFPLAFLKDISITIGYYRNLSTDFDFRIRYLVLPSEEYSGSIFSTNSFVGVRCHILLELLRI